MTDFEKNLKQHNLVAILSLFASSSTLICCALPALLVTLGLGASLAGLINAAPWISELSNYKIEFFIGTGVILSLATFMLWKARNLPCPADKAKAKACNFLRKTSQIILGISILFYLTGAFFTFFAADLFY